jgi:Protein of unknown function (DUF2970)
MTVPETPRSDRSASPLQVAKAVFWSFLGIRRRDAHENDAVTIKPLQVVIAGIIGGILFVLVLILIVRIVIRTAGA